MQHIRMQREGAVGFITIDRPARFNSMDVRTAQDFRHAGLQYAREEDVRVVVLCGLPNMFCSGADLKFIRDGGDAEEVGYLAPGAARGGYGETFVFGCAWLCHGFPFSASISPGKARRRSRPT